MTPKQGWRPVDNGDGVTAVHVTQAFSSGVARSPHIICSSLDSQVDSFSSKRMHRRHLVQQPQLGASAQQAQTPSASVAATPQVPSATKAVPPASAATDDISEPVSSSMTMPQGTASQPLVTLPNSAPSITPAVHYSSDASANAEAAAAALLMAALRAVASVLYPLAQVLGTASVAAAGSGGQPPLVQAMSGLGPGTPASVVMPFTLGSSNSSSSTQVGSSRAPAGSSISSSSGPGMMPMASRLAMPSQHMAQDAPLAHAIVNIGPPTSTATSLVAGALHPTSIQAAAARPSPAIAPASLPSTVPAGTVIPAAAPSVTVIPATYAVTVPVAATPATTSSLPGATAAATAGGGISVTTNTPVSVINEISSGGSNTDASKAGNELLQAAALASLLGRKRVVVIPVLLG